MTARSSSARPVSGRSPSKPVAGGWGSPGRVNGTFLRLPAPSPSKPLPVTVEHALRVAALPPIHGDPFDRLLVAQAQVEGLPIITAAPAIGPLRGDVHS